MVCWLQRATPEATAQSTSNQEPIHTHTFEMLSRVLIGSLVNEVYDVVPDPESPMVRCSIRFSDGKSVRQAVEASRAILVSSEQVHAPGVYSLRSGTYHISRPSSDLVVTLMSKEAVDPDARASVLVPAQGCETTEELRQFEQWPSGWQLIDEALYLLNKHEHL